MKRIVLCLLMVGIMTATAITGLFCTESAVRDCRRFTAEIKEAFEAGDIQRAQKCAEELERRWSSFSELHIFIIDGGHALEISNVISRISAMVKAENEELPVECASADKLLELLGSEQRPDFFNII